MPLQATSGAASYDAFGGGVAAVPNYIEDVFSTYLYTGNGGTQTITNSIDLSTKGGLVWIKQRNSTAISGGLPSQHLLFDTNRGANNMLASNSTYQSLPLNEYSFNNTGFTVAQYTNIDGTYPYEGNQASVPYASWTFRKQPKFFDVVTYTGNGTVKTVNHNLGSVPGVMIVKCTSAGENWAVYHRSLGATKYLELNNTNAASTSVGSRWDAEPTSTSFSVGYNGSVNSSGETYVAYLFAHDAGGFGLSGTENVVSCGSYTGNGSTNLINLGFEPQWLMVKRSNSTGFWHMFDVMRGMPVSGNNMGLTANTSNAEGEAYRVNPTATGFEIRGETAVEINANASTYIYIAIRRGPMKVPTSGTSVFSPTYGLSASNSEFVNAGFPIDLNWRGRTTGDNVILQDRLRGASQLLFSNLADAESSSSAYKFTTQNGCTFTSTANFSNWINWSFRRAPNFFDEVCYSGNDTAGTTQAHNLGVAPEFMIVKRRNQADGWFCYHSALGATKYIPLNDYQPATTTSSIWDNTAPTASVFTLGWNSAVNGSGSTYVAYLFSTLAGVSKVGSYTGTGTTLQVNCGFTSGARFVLIKRTNGSGDSADGWYVWDSARGIVSGNDPYLLLNSTAAEVTTTDYIDTYSAGFEISSTAPAAINASGGTYIFLAIA